MSQGEILLAPTDPQIREALPAYDIESVIGRGSWGLVLKARHRQLGREVAVKQLPMEFAAQADVRRRFVNEARLLARLDHPHIVPVYDFIEREGVCLLVMEYLPGGTVWKRFNEEGFDYLDSCSVALATCAALEFAHRHGVLHRDIKPENLMFSGQGILKVTDFGIAKVLGAASTMGTRAGEVLGSPAYIAPEQATGSTLGPFTDVYATAVVLYELLSGQLPFPDDGDPLMVMYRHVHEAPMPLSEAAPEVPPQLAEVVMYGLATDPALRYQTAEEFGIAIARAASAAFGPGWLQRSSVPVMGGGPIIAATERHSPTSITFTPEKRQVPEALPVEQGAPALAEAPQATAQGAPSSQTGEATTDIGARAEPVQRPPVARVPSPPPKAARIPALVIAVATMTVAVAMALFGPARRPPDLPRGDGRLSIQGNQVAQETVTVDFDRPVEVRIELPRIGEVRSPEAAARLENVRLLVVASLPGGFSVTIPSQRTTVDGGEIAFAFEGRQFKYLIAGKSTWRLEVERPVSAGSAEEIASQRTVGTVQVKPSRWNPIAIPTVIAALGLLAVVAYAEALLIPLRRQRRRGGAVVGLAVLGLAGGACITFLGWSAGIAESTSITLWAVSLLCCVAAVAGGIWAMKSGRSEALSPELGAATTWPQHQP